MWPLFLLPLLLSRSACWHHPQHLRARASLNACTTEPLPAADVEKAVSSLAAITLALAPMPLIRPLVLLQARKVGGDVGAEKAAETSTIVRKEDGFKQNITGVNDRFDSVFSD